MCVIYIYTHTHTHTHQISLKDCAKFRDFPGGPVVETPCSQCRGHEFHPWSGNYEPAACEMETPNTVS